MKNLIALFLCLPLLVGASSATCQSTSAASASPQTVTGNIQLEPIKELRKDVQEWPLIVNPSTPAEQRVNATLTRLNQVLAKAVRECDANLRDSMKGASAKAIADAVSEDWSRKVHVTMTGPRFLSLVAADDTNCGGAHPNEDRMAMVFDMTTGAPVNWLALLPKSAGASSFVDSVEDGSKMGALVLPALQAINLAKASDECKEAFQDSQSFLIWPDAQHETLVAQAFDLPHAADACAIELGLTMEQARKLGFDESVLRAIEQAHRQIAATPKT